MVKLALKGHKKSISLVFDLPAPKAITAEPQFRQLIDLIEAVGGFEFDRNERGDLLGLEGPIESWQLLIDYALPAREAAFQTAILESLIAEGQEQAEGLKVNFHQNPFDTVERYWKFILGQGHFIDYFFNRLDWYVAPKNRLVAPFPLHVDLESASTCNMNCPMCYRDQMETLGQMDWALFTKAVDECSENGVFSIRLSWRGETLTHPRIKEMISYATARIKNVSFLTNAFYIDRDMADHFIAAGVSYVAVSFDGIKDNYEAIRHPAKFEESFAKLEYLKTRRDEQGKSLPQIRLCTIWPAVKDDPAAYQETMRPASDYMVCNPYINFRGPARIKEGFICQYPWERIVIGWDGRAQCCTGWNADDIILGNVEEKTIREMWLSEKMNRIREMHAAGRRMELSSCAACRHGSQGDPDVEIRDIIQRRY